MSSLNTVVELTLKRLTQLVPLVDNPDGLLHSTKTLEELADKYIGDDKLILDPPPGDPADDLADVIKLIFEELRVTAPDLKNTEEVLLSSTTLHDLVDSVTEWINVYDPDNADELITDLRKERDEITKLILDRLEELIAKVSTTEEILEASRSTTKLLASKVRVTEYEKLYYFLTVLNTKMDAVDVKHTEISDELREDVDENAASIIKNADNHAEHLSDTNNPHETTKSQVGLGNVPNYSATSSLTDGSESKFATAKATKDLKDIVDTLDGTVTDRTINTTAPLSGGGDLSEDRTLTIRAATTEVNGAVQLNDATNSTSVTEAATANAAKKAYDRGSSGITKADAAQSDIDAHEADTDNPHEVTKSQVGLSNVDNVKQLPITGGTLTGDLIIDTSLTYNIKGISTPEDFDFNDITRSMSMNLTEVSVANGAPPLEHCTLMVTGSDVRYYAVQQAIERTTKKFYFRTYHFSPDTWSEWSKVYTDADKPTKADVGLSNVDNVKQAPSTRKITTDAPLTGGGDLSTDRALSISTASTSSLGVTQLYDDIDDTATNLAATANAAKKAYDRGSTALTRSVRGPSALSAETDLNSLNSSGQCGVYYQSVNRNTSGNNYPEESAGSLTVYRAVGIIQVYRLYNNSKEYQRTYYDGRWTDWVLRYDTDNKPSKSDVGLGNVDNFTSTSSLTDGSESKFSTAKAAKDLKDTIDSVSGDITDRKINTTAPLTGGGDLSTDRTLAVNAGTVDAAGVLRLSDAIDSEAKDRAATANAVRNAYARGSSGISKADAAQAAVDGHIAKKDNPHEVTKSQVGLSSVDNVKQCPATRKVNAKELSADITLSASDVKARADTWVPEWGEVTDKPSSFPPSSHEHAWDQITDKPSTFPPSTHTHTIANVDGLQTELDGKEPKLDADRTRKITISNDTPSGGSEGDIWFVTDSTSEALPDPTDTELRTTIFVRDFTASNTEASRGYEKDHDGGIEFDRLMTRRVIGLFSRRSGDPLTTLYFDGTVQFSSISVTRTDTDVTITQDNINASNVRFFNAFFNNSSDNNKFVPCIIKATP